MEELTFDGINLTATPDFPTEAGKKARTQNNNDNHSQPRPYTPHLFLAPHRRSIIHDLYRAHLSPLLPMHILDMSRPLLPRSLEGLVVEKEDRFVAPFGFVVFLGAEDTDYRVKDEEGREV